VLKCEDNCPPIQLQNRVNSLNYDIGKFTMEILAYAKAQKSMLVLKGLKIDLEISNYLKLFQNLERKVHLASAVGCPSSGGNFSRLSGYQCLNQFAHNT
jgi:hypothetical protein